MKKKVSELRKEFDRLVSQGDMLLYAMINDLGHLDEETRKSLKVERDELPRFLGKYDLWYSEGIQVVKQLILHRLDDFVKCYKNEKRKEIVFSTYGISDYLIGLRKLRGSKVILDGSAALPKMQNQVAILESAKAKFESSLFDLKEVLQADLFDSELEAANELCKKGFVRGAGAIAGVVLERHLGHICEHHGIKSRKKHPSISDYNDLLKEKEVINTPKWRSIQRLGDLRNLCTHQKDSEPTKDNVSELIKGVDKVIKTVF